MVNEKVMKKLDYLQTEIELKFQQIKEEFNHTVNKGTNGEYLLSDFLKAYFPSSKYSFGNGEVIDNNGSISGQVDIIIANEYHPCINNLPKPSIYFIEGVACCGEVKMLLTTTELENTLKNCYKFKQLTPIIDKGAAAYGNIADLKRFVSKRPFFLFAYKSQLTIETIFNKINEYNHNNKIDMVEQIDGVFLLDRGSIINLGDGKGSLKGRTDNGKEVVGYIIKNKEKYPNILANMLFWLNAVIQPYQIITPIINKYIY